MRRQFQLTLVMIAVSIFAAFAGLPAAADEALPPCSAEEFIAIFELIAEHQVGAERSFESLSELLGYSHAQLEERETVLERLPRCADGVEAQRLLLSLGADIVGRNALDLANLPSRENPYRQQLASDQQRIEALAQALLSRDRANAPSAGSRRILACTDAERQLLADRMAESLTPGAGDAIDILVARLAWREEALPQLPACAEALPIGWLLYRVSSDAAASQALAYAGVSAGTNPYDDLEAAAREELRVWLQLTRRELSPGSSAASRLRGDLPACSASELALAEASLQFAKAALAAESAAPASLSAQLALSREYVQNRELYTRQLPGCAEAYAAGWWLAEANSDAAARAVLPERDIQPSQVAATAALTRLESLLADPRLPAASGSRRPPFCSESQVIYFNVYLLPALYRYTEAALNADATELAALEEESRQLRELLWQRLPRCEASLALGWRMRRVAADFVALLALEAAGAAPRDIPYFDAIVADMTALSAELRALNAGSYYAAGRIYYVIVDGYANVRSCGSTECEAVGLVQGGDALRVVDDGGSWYEIQLSDGGSAWIASFLLSRTPPGA